MSEDQEAPTVEETTTLAGPTTDTQASPEKKQTPSADIGREVARKAATELGVKFDEAVYDQFAAVGASVTTHSELRKKFGNLYSYGIKLYGIDKPSPDMGERGTYLVQAGLIDELSRIEPSESWSKPAKDREEPIPLGKERVPYILGFYTGQVDRTLASEMDEPYDEPNSIGGMLPLQMYAAVAESLPFTKSDGTVKTAKMGALVSSPKDTHPLNDHKGLETSNPDIVNNFRKANEIVSGYFRELNGKGLLSDLSDKWIAEGIDRHNIRGWDYKGMFPAVTHNESLWPDNARFVFDKTYPSTGPTFDI